MRYSLDNVCASNSLDKGTDFERDLLRPLRFVLVRSFEQIPDRSLRRNWGGSWCGSSCF